MKGRGKVAVGLLILLAAMFLFAAKVLWFEGPPIAVYQSFENPDHRYKIVVGPEHSLLRQILPTGPGQGGDVPGIVYLVDVRRDRILRKKRIALASAITDVDWTETNVSVRFFIEWDLPPR
jgi:hypothetical protein